MTIGTELDQAFYNLGQRITRLEKKEVEYPIVNEFADKETVLGIEATLTAQIEQLEDRIDEQESFDPDDLRCDLESQMEEVADNLSYESDRIDNFEVEYMTESEVEYRIEEAISDRLDDLVCDAVNERAVPYNDFFKACERIRDLEDRLNKPSITARIMRWLREGPSIKEVATSWYASIRRGS